MLRVPLVQVFEQALDEAHLQTVHAQKMERTLQLTMSMVCGHLR